MSNLSEEEKKAIEYFKEINSLKINTNLDLRYTESELDNSEILLNLIDRLQKEIEHNYFLYIKEKNKSDKLLVFYNEQKKEIEKKDKVMEIAIKYIDEHTYRDMEECEFGEANNMICSKDCLNCIKNYLDKQVEVEDE